MMEETAGFSGVSSFKACNGLKTYPDSLPLGFSTGAVAGRGTVAYREKLKCLASGPVPGDSFLPGKTPEARQWHCPLSGPSPTQSHRATPYQVLPHPGNYLRLCPIQLTGDFSTIGHTTKKGSQSSST